MNRCYVIIVCGAFFLWSVAAEDDTRKKEENIFLTDKDIITPNEQSGLKLIDDLRDYRFIGDLVIGNRLADETVFRRSMEVNNPRNIVYTSTVRLNVDRGIIHFLSVSNEKNSFAVACDEPFSLGRSDIVFNVRVPPNTNSLLWLLVAAH